ncbi:hypothetical protein SAMN04487897_1422 [Paenibacillus sp. yr247]|nr:hypothetical protein SAMN04487897_1422 [Paenibacillus sp. yr247]
MTIETENRIKTQCETMLEKHSFKRTTRAEASVYLRDAEKIFLESLKLTIDGLHWVGHNVIYHGNNSVISIATKRELPR